MALACPCKLVGQYGINPKTWIYRCTKNGETKQFPIQTTNQTQAEVEVCLKYEEFWDMGQPVPKGGGSGGCIPSDTPVKMADGTERPVGDLKPGDEILCGSLETTEVISRPIFGLWYEYDVDLVELTNSDNETIVTSRDQPVITSSGPVKAEYIFLGASTHRFDEKSRTVSREGARISRRQDLREKADVVSLDLDGNYYYFAGRTSLWVLTCHKGGGGPKKKM